MKWGEKLMRLISGFMLVVFLAGVMPKEYIHDLLFDHVDDVHPEYKTGEIVFTPKHNHCSFVAFVLAPFVKSEKQFLTFREVFPVYNCYVLPEYSQVYSAIQSTLSLRGPPAGLVPLFNIPSFSRA